MTDRMTSKRVREAFETFKSNAEATGFHSENWDLIEPQFKGGYWCLVDRGHDGHQHLPLPTPFDRALGVGNREVHAILRAMAKTLFAVNLLQSKTENIEIGSQIS